MNFKYIVIIFDKRKNILYMTPTLLSLLNYSFQEIYHRNLLDLLYGDSFEEKTKLLASFQEKLPYELEIDLLTKEGNPLRVQGTLDKIFVNGDEVFLFLGKEIPQIPSLSYVFEKLLKSIVEFNKIVFETKLEEEIFERICKILVEELGFVFAWVGVPDYEEGVVKPLIWYGYEDGYLSKIKIPLDPQIREGKGPTAISIREGRIVINPDSRTNPYFAPFRDEALKRGYLSSVAIPLLVTGKVKYVLNIYSSQPFFLREEIHPFLNFIKANMEHALERIEREFFNYLLSVALEESDYLIFLTNMKGEIQYVNSYTPIVLGYEESEVLNKSILTLFEPVDKDATINWDEILSRDFIYSNVYYVRKKDGELLTLLLKIIPFNFQEKRRFILFVGRDITLERELLDTLGKIRVIDTLTGAYNLYGISEKFSEIFLKEHLKKESQFILFVNLDLYNFTAINKLYGFEVGEKILKVLVERLKARYKDKILVSRVAADEFLVLFLNIHNYVEIPKILDHLINLLKEPIVIDNIKITLKYHIGISSYPMDGEWFEELYRKANIALSFAKKESPNTCKFYDSSIEVLIKKNLEIEKLIESAFENKWFNFYFQPYFHASNLALAGAEALIRIVKPEGEVISPYVFIEGLEKSPLRKEFEVWAMRYIVELINSWKISIGINLYPDTFMNQLFWLEVKGILKTLQAPLVIEITERAIIKDPSKILEVVKEIQTLNPLIKVALDDFGTGYSNFEYLLEAPFDLIKIDLSFVRVMDRDERRRGIVKNIIDLAHVLGVKALAEGVENEEIVNLLDIMGCDYLQGYFFDKPLPLEEFQRKYLLK